MKRSAFSYQQPNRHTLTNFDKKMKMDSSVDYKVNQPEQQTSSVIIIKDDKQKANIFDCKLCSRQYSSSQSY